MTGKTKWRIFVAFWILWTVTFFGLGGMIFYLVGWTDGYKYESREDW